MEWFNALAKSASDAYIADQASDAQKQQATAQVLAAQSESGAKILSSRNLMIAGGVLAVAVLAFVFMRRK